MSTPRESSVEGNPAAVLIDRERIRGASRIIPEGASAAAVSEDQIRAVASDVELLCRAHKINRKALAQAIGYSPSVVSEFLGGKYAGAKAQVAIDLENWLVEETHRRQRPQTTQFVWTTVAMQIKAVASYCLDYKKIGLVYGPDSSGIGKTTSLQAIHQEIGPRRSTLVTTDKVDANPTGTLVKVCRAMHVADHGSNRNKFERIVAHLRGRSHLLLIDQIHNLRGGKEDKPFYILADLYDATGTAQLWCGTADLVAYLQRQQKRNADESLAQIRRRIFPCIDLMESVRPDGNGEPLATVEHVREMFARNKLKLTAAAARFLCAMLNEPDSGGVGVCVQLVEYATAIGERRRLESIDIPIIKEAMRLGFSSARAAVLLARVGDVPATTRIAKAG
jgi:DNA transposition AAA+ family ATPase